MTRLQLVVFELDGQYLGHPYFVTRNALYNAIAQRVDEATRCSLRVSHGVFVPHEYGEYTAAHSADGYAGKLGGALPDVEAYADLFAYRDPAQRWLLDSRPRDAHNTHPVQRPGDHVAFAPTCWFGRPEGMRDRRRSVSWHVQCYLHASSGGAVVPLDDSVLTGLQVGGARNYGFGELTVADTQLVDVEALDFAQLEAAQGGAQTDPWRVELVTPYVLDSEYPGAESQSVPWWWGVTEDEVRTRETRLVDDGESYRVRVVDHGQVVPYTGSKPVRTAVNGVFRVGTHSRFGFGELRVWAPGTDRVPERADGDRA